MFISKNQVGKYYNMRLKSSREFKRLSKREKLNVLIESQKEDLKNGYNYCRGDIFDYNSINKYR
jgi:hypothetical protein